MVIAPKVARTLKQRYAECMAASKVINKPRPNMALQGYSISTMLKVMYYVWGFLRVPKETGNVITPMSLILLLLKP
jgi:hypothetical protein